MKEQVGISDNYENIKLANYKHIRKRRITNKWHKYGFQQDHRRKLSQIKQI